MRYYVQLQLENKALRTVALKWRQNNEDKECYYISSKKKTDKEIVVTGEARFTAIEFYAFEEDNHIPVTINGQKCLSVSPREECIFKNLVLEEGMYIMNNTQYPQVGGGGST